MKVGDLIRLPEATVSVWNLKNPIALLVDKLPRADKWEYDWKVFVDGRFIEFGRQIEDSGEVVCSIR